MLKSSILALCAALACAGAASAHPRDDYRHDSYERGDPRAPGGYERGDRYEYGDPRGPVYGAGERHERRSEYDSGWRDVRGGDRYGATGDHYAYRDDYRDDRAPRGRGYSLPTYGDAAQHYGYPCGCGAYARGGELTLGSSFYYDGGVGPIPDGGYAGGGGGFVFAGAGAHASASASAYASSRASVRIGGFKGGGHKGHHGGKGGK
jgi:hypothetical protein